MNRRNDFFILFILMIIISLILFFLFLPPDPSQIDSDNDGITNDKDIFPNNQYESKDSDLDGIGDNSDRFPYDPSASMDSDMDGYPDQWNIGKTNENSTSTPPLSLDDFPFDPFEHVDSDGDKIGDNTDVFPNDPFEYLDDDLDGIGNNQDKNPYVDLGFQISLDAFKINKKVDIFPRAQVYFVVKINNQYFKEIDNNKNYWRVWVAQEQFIDYTFSFDINDTTDEDFTRIEISMYDKDILFQDDCIDINPNQAESSVNIYIDHNTNTVNVNTLSEGSTGSLWFTVILPEDMIPSTNFDTIYYNWYFQKKAYSLTLNISKDKYIWYTQRSENRSPQSIGKEAMISYITINDEIIQQLTEKLLILSQKQGLNSSEKINFILSFIQNNIDYVDDMSSKGMGEYWRYPIETLYEKKGDCEDSSILFQSIIKNADYDVVMLFYIIDEDIGHLSSGVSIDDLLSGYFVNFNEKKYYYCETTSPGFLIGDKPIDIPDDPEIIIAIP